MPSSAAFRAKVFVCAAGHDSRYLMTATQKNLAAVASTIHHPFMSNILGRLRQQVAHLTKSTASLNLVPTAPKTSSFSTMSVRSGSLFSILVLLFSGLVVLWLNNGIQDTKATITDWVKPGDKSGEFKRQQSSFRNFISKDPSAEFPAEKGRYHLYVSYACPWGMRDLKNAGPGD